MLVLKTSNTILLIKVIFPLFIIPLLVDSIVPLLIFFIVPLLVITLFPERVLLFKFILTILFSGITISSLISFSIFILTSVLSGIISNNSLKL